MEHNIVDLSSNLRRYANEYIEELLKDNGLKGIVPSHGGILLNLYHDKTLSMQELAARIKRTKATTTVLVDKLEKLGLVVRSKSDRDSRITLVTLTQKGLDYEDLFNRIGTEINRKVTKNLTEDEALLLEKLLEKAISGFSN
ncbi:DNA-binding transcriptional regulator, MarR family [Succinivibrio dextrinosolvens]|uniref:MarR family winged helix-turn-helix transcriptional regulator n=1 Tax=Succinivibrio dextrinosolvens TaxID=83771 RepID=UPI0008DF4D8D|nr:MarR family transcriptional regulator [Succinivibrio dextrinosolvens]SFS72145.1 DNA-binding transcriptional regulator, MarR family [Succinivibrio dextrinosolvens]